ncbi:MAG: cation-transporting P-type ATPase, partial [Actinobacteria bacterium]
MTGKILVHFNPEFIDRFSIIISIDNISKNNVNVISLPAKAKAAVNVPALIREPEDLPLARQVLQVMFSGAVLLVLFFKHRLLGRSALSYSRGLFNLATVTTVVTGYPIFYSGLQHLSRRRRINYDLVISAATLSLLVLRESFTGLLVTWLVNLSGLLQTLNLIKSHQEIKKAAGVLPQEVWLLVDGFEVAVPAHRVMAGDIVVVHPDEYVPVDGKVVSGQAAVDESRITGSPHPVYKEAGTEVLAGSEVLEGMLQIRVEQAGRETYLNRIMQNVSDQLTRHEECHSVDCQRSDRLISLSLLLAGAVYLLTRNAGRSLAMVLAACPSAAGLAAPTAIGAAVGSAANRGIYVKDGKYLLAAGQSDTVVFDKTGTLTAEQAEIQEVLVVDKKYSKEDIIAMA